MATRWPCRARSASERLTGWFVVESFPELWCIEAPEVGGNFSGQVSRQVSPALIQIRAEDLERGEEMLGRVDWKRASALSSVQGEISQPNKGRAERALYCRPVLNSGRTDGVVLRDDFLVDADNLRRSANDEAAHSAGFKRRERLQFRLRLTERTRGRFVCPRQQATDARGPRLWVSPWIRGRRTTACRSDGDHREAARSEPPRRGVKASMRRSFSH